MHDTWSVFHSRCSARFFRVEDRVRWLRWLASWEVGIIVCQNTPDQLSFQGLVSKAAFRSYFKSLGVCKVRIRPCILKRSWLWVTPHRKRSLWSCRNSAGREEKSWEWPKQGQESATPPPHGKRRGRELKVRLGTDLKQTYPVRGDSFWNSI